MNTSTLCKQSSLETSAASCLLYLKESSWPGTVVHKEEDSNNFSIQLISLPDLRGYDLVICINLVRCLSQLYKTSAFSVFIFFQFIWSLFYKWSLFASAFLLRLFGKCTSASDICLLSPFVNYEVIPTPFINKLPLEQFRGYNYSLILYEFAKWLSAYISFVCPFFFHI